jgi:hypothetical protein
VIISGTPQHKTLRRVRDRLLHLKSACMRTRHGATFGHAKQQWIAMTALLL